MVKEQPTRTVVKRFRKAGWVAGRPEGSHTKWHCPENVHTFSLPDGHRTISPGVYRKALAALEGCDHS